MSLPSNQFYNSTKDSYYRANTFFEDAHSRLIVGANKDPRIVLLRDRTEPLFQSWKDLYVAWIGSKGTYAGNTDTWESIAQELRANKYMEWKSAIIAAGIGIKTATYKMLLPNGHKYFNSGRYERRTAEVKTLINQLDTLKETDFTTTKWAILSACKADIAAFYDRMTHARSTQQETEKNAVDAPMELKQAHKNLCTMLYRNLGLLMDMYPDSPETINNYYEWQTLKGKQKTKTTPPEAKGQDPKDTSTKNDTNSDTTTK